MRDVNPQVRAGVIRDYMVQSGYKRAVCIGSHLAAYALRDAGVSVLEIGPLGVLQTNKYWTPEEIHVQWPDLFDATPGHLPAFILSRIAIAYRGWMAVDVQADMRAVGHVNVPTASGETIVCLRWAFPDAVFRRVPSCTIDSQYHTHSQLYQVTR